jgi:uncharacterized membrane protein
MSMPPPAAPTEETAAAAQTRKAGTRAGFAVIAFGVVTAIILYVIQSRSPDSIRERHALELAIMYAAFCGVAGLIIIRWFNRMAPDHTTAPLPGADAPTREQTWKRRKGTLGGLLAIALGLLTAIVMYFVDTSSPIDYFRWMHAMDMAIVHAVLWGIVGVIIILYHNRQPPDPAATNYNPNDPYH